MNRSFSQHRLEFIAIIILALIGGLFWWLVQQNQSLRHDLTALKSDSISKKDLADNNRLINGTIAGNYAMERPVTSTEGDFVYMPDLRLKLPYSPFAQSIAYAQRNNDYNDAGTLETDVLSTWFVQPEKMTTMNCANLLRLKFEPKPNPYSPHEKPTTLHLSDGRTLQLYQAVNIDECSNSWSTSVSPSQMNDIFLRAQSY